MSESSKLLGHTRGFCARVCIHKRGGERAGLCGRLDPSSIQLCLWIIPIYTHIHTYRYLSKFEENEYTKVLVQWWGKK